MSGSIEGKKKYYRRKHKMEQAGLRIRRWADSKGAYREIRLILKKKGIIQNG